MAELKDSIKKEPVKIREKVLANGNVSLYLDIYYKGKRMREFLKLYLVPESTPADKEQNRQTRNLAYSIRSKRQLELARNEYDIVKPIALDTPFLAYYRKVMGEYKDVNSTRRSEHWRQWRNGLRYLDVYANEKTTFRDITKEWLLGYKKYLDTVPKTLKRKHHDNEFMGLAENTKYSYFMKMKILMNRAVVDGVIDKNPMLGIKNFPMAESERLYLTEDEIKKLVATPCQVKWLKPVFLFSCFTGLRKGDIIDLTWSNIQQLDGYTRVIFKQNKTGGQEYLDINEQAVECMGERKNPTDKIFPDFVYNSYMTMHLKKWILEAGIEKEITFHCARHTFATLMLTCGVPIYTVSKLLGHKKVTTTQIYGKVLDVSKRDAIDLMPTFLEKPKSKKKK